MFELVFLSFLCRVNLFLTPYPEVTNEHLTSVCLCVQLDPKTGAPTPL